MFWSAGASQNFQFSASAWNIGGFDQSFASWLLRTLRTPVLSWQNDLCFSVLFSPSISNKNVLLTLIPVWNFIGKETNKRDLSGACHGGAVPWGGLAQAGSVLGKEERPTCAHCCAPSRSRVPLRTNPFSGIGVLGTGTKSFVP